jgi:hypothetical protein
MNISVKITPNAQLTTLLRGSSMLAGPAVMQRAGQAVTDYLRRYHSNFGNAWRGYRYMSPSLGFADKVVAGWQNPVVSGNRVTITNTFGLLKHKVTGGTISPVRAQYLTIPLISEAKGKTVAEYRAGTSTPLFQAGMALCQKIGGRLTAVYALSKGVSQEPWPGAMPPDEAMALVFTMAVNQEIARLLGTGRLAA